MQRRLILEAFAAALGALAVVAVLAWAGVVTRMDHMIYDAALLMDTPGPASDVTVVAIDEPSLAAIGRWPWPRDVHARLIDRLRASRPAAIGYDVLFTERSTADRPLAYAIGAARRLFLPVAFTVPGNAGRPFEVQRPVPPIAAAVAGLGQAVIAFDDDGLVRRASLLAGDAHLAIPHLAELLFRARAGHPSPTFARVAPARLPEGALTLGGDVLIPFGRASGRVPTVSFASVLAGEVPAEAFRGRVVLVGSTAAGSGDQYPVPASGATAAMPGVEILAHLVQGLIDDRLVRPSGPLAHGLMLLLPLGLLVAALLMLPPRVNLLLGLMLALALLAASLLALRFGRTWVPPAGGLLAVLIVYPLWAWRRLAAASAYITRELTALEAEPDPLPRGRRRPRFAWSLGDATMRQAELLHGAIDRLRELRRFFAESVEHLPDATVVLDPAGAVLLANDAARDLLGPDLAGRPLADAVHPLAPDMPPLDPASPTDREIESVDGRTFILRAVPLVGQAGTEAGWIARLTDVSAIRTAFRQREDALQLLTHDMRAPQAAILALLDGPDDPARTPARIAGYARRTLALADGFVQLARAENATYGDALLDVGALLAEAADEVWPLAQARQVRIETRSGDGEHLVRGDRSLLARALINLLDNAVKHSPAGGAIVADASAAPDRSPPMTLVRIADQGPGLDEAQVDSVFRRFRSGRPGGAGLGLAFVGTVVDRHGGTVRCRNRPEGGAEFLLWLPLEEDAAAA